MSDLSVSLRMIAMFSGLDARPNAREIIKLSADELERLEVEVARLSKVGPRDICEFCGLRISHGDCCEERMGLGSKSKDSR